MRPAARLQSAIELLDEIIISARDNGPAADNIAKQFFKKRRYAGSKDRRAVRDLVWQAIRKFGERQENARSVFVTMADEDEALAELFDGSDYGPATISAEEARADGGAVPEWILPELSEWVGTDEQAALLQRAPLDIRVNPARATIADVQDMLPEAERLEKSQYGLRLPVGFLIEQHSLYQKGAVEIQDLGSQMIVEACPLNSGATAVDLCAGAGGKTLAMAAAMGNHGRIIATDINRNRLQQLPDRAHRADCGDIVETLLLNPGQEEHQLRMLGQRADLVLVDAPCSGSGTWRRNPETRWRLTPRRLEATIKTQARLLDIAASLVKDGGYLVYAVCSLIEREGDRQIAEFLTRNRAFAVEYFELPVGRNTQNGYMLTPARDETDGFFFARLKKL